MHSIASLLGLGIEIPDYSTLSRRSRLLRKKLRIPKAASNQPIHLMIDSTGLRIHVGTARKPPKQRAWRKLHIAVDRETGNIVASELTASRARDATRVPALLTQIQAPLASVAADSAYDKEAVYEAIEAHSPGRRTRVVIPPQRNATLSQNSNTAMQERDRHIRAIERHGRREWYKLSGCTKRSMVGQVLIFLSNLRMVPRARLSCWFLRRAFGEELVSKFLDSPDCENIHPYAAPFTRCGQQDCEREFYRGLLGKEVRNDFRPTFEFSEGALE